MRGRIVLAAAAMMAAGPIFGGVVVELARFGEDANQPTSTITVYAQGAELRVDQLDEERNSSRLLSVAGKVFDIDLSERHYAVIERAQIVKARRSADPVESLRAELLAEVPPAHRYAVERLMSAPLDRSVDTADVVVTPTAQSLSVAQRTCRVHRVLIEQQLRYEYCVVPQTPPLNEFMNASRSASTLIAEFFGALGLPWMQSAMRLHWTHAYDVPGVPLQVQEFEDGKVLEEFRVLSVRQQALSADVFKLPQDLRRRAVLDFPFEGDAAGEDDDDFWQ